tara:strand:+ start:172 stop:981 length:810 start_codon:yes stop_codon:yes gene_type:complete
MEYTKQQYYDKRIKLLPIELKLCIYSFIDIETRMQMLMPLFEDTKRYLYRSKDTFTLLRKYEQLIYMQFFKKNNDTNVYSTKPYFKQLLPPTTYLKNNEIQIQSHPVLKLLKQELYFSAYIRRIIMSYDNPNLIHKYYHNNVVDKIQECFNLISTLVSYNNEFDYRIRKILIRFLHHLTHISNKVKEEEHEQRMILYERKVRNYYRKKILPRIHTQSKKMQRKIMKTNKDAEKKSKIEAREMVKTKKLFIQNARKAAKHAKTLSKSKTE